MEVETERVERTMTRSPKDKILVDSGDDEENTKAPLNDGTRPTDLSDDVTAAGDRDTKHVDDVSADSSEQQAFKVEQVEPTESVSSDIRIIATSEPSSNGDEFSADVTQAVDTSALSSEPPPIPKASNGEERMSASDVPVHDIVAASEPRTASEPLKEEEETSADALSENIAFVTPEFSSTIETLSIDDEKSAQVLPTYEVNSEASSDASDRLVLTDKASSESVEHGQFENDHQVTGLSSGNDHHECVDHKNVMNSQELGGHVNGICPSGVQENVTQGLSDTGISLSEDTNACKEDHSNAQGKHSAKVLIRDLQK